MTATGKTLPRPLYTAANVRELDRIAIEEEGIPGITLMKRAGEASFRLLRERWPNAASVTVICGNGNNGGDGYVVAKLASGAGMQVKLLHHGNLESQTGDALTARQEAEQVGLVIEPYQSEKVTCADVVVDALLGTGLDRQLDDEWRELVIDINQHAKSIFENAATGSEVVFMAANEPHAYVAGEIIECMACSDNVVSELSWSKT